MARTDSDRYASAACYLEAAARELAQVEAPSPLLIDVRDLARALAEWCAAGGRGEA